MDDTSMIYTEFYKNKKQTKTIKLCFLPASNVGLFQFKTIDLE